MFFKKMLGLQIYTLDSKSPSVEKLRQFLVAEQGITQKLRNILNSIYDFSEDDDLSILKDVYSFMYVFYMLRWKAYSQLLEIPTDLWKYIRSDMSNFHRNIIKVLYRDLPRKHTKLKKYSGGTFQFIKIRVANANTYRKIKELQNSVSIEWPRRVIVVRHGQSALNKALEQKQRGEYVYAYDNAHDSQIPLSEEGTFQAIKTGKLLRQKFTHNGININVCYSSPYLRTIQTAQNIIENIGQKVNLELRDEIREKEFGVEHGISNKELKERFPVDAMLKKRDSKFFYRPHGGESYQDVRQRFRDFIGTLKRKNSNQTILVVTHQVTYKAFRSLIKGTTVSEIEKYPETPNCGVAIYELQAINNGYHLVLKEYDIKGLLILLRIYSARFSTLISGTKIVLTFLDIYCSVMVSLNLSKSFFEEVLPVSGL